MIISCPECSARYKVDDSKISGKGAKINCPRCSHKFVVQRGDEKKSDAKANDVVPSDIESRDFTSVGVHWTARKGLGLTYPFKNLEALHELLDDGQLDPRDSLSYNGQDWRPIDTIEDLNAFFWDIWQKAEAGQLSTPAPNQESPAPEEDMEDAPTQLVGHSSELADEIRKALEDTPAPAPARPDPAPAKASPPPPVTNTAETAPTAENVKPPVDNSKTKAAAAGIGIFAILGGLTLVGLVVAGAILMSMTS